MLSVGARREIGGSGQSGCGKPARGVALGSDAMTRRDHQDPDMGVMVVATDGSPGADLAFEQALELASATGDSLAVVTVWQALQGDYGLSFPPSAILSELLSAEREHAEATLESAARRARTAGVAVDTRLLTGDPADQICTFAAEVEARLIAVGSHGYGAVVRLLVGSVSAAVIRQAGRPVLVCLALPA
jgi:nucleotide-binding universal stress UspA family protein